MTYRSPLAPPRARRAAYPTRQAISLRPAKVGELNMQATLPVDRVDRPFIVAASRLDACSINMFRQGPC